MSSIIPKAPNNAEVISTLIELYDFSNCKREDRALEILPGSRMTPPQNGLVRSTVNRNQYKIPRTVLQTIQIASSLIFLYPPPP